MSEIEKLLQAGEERDAHLHVYREWRPGLEVDSVVESACDDMLVELKRLRAALRVAVEMGVSGAGYEAYAQHEHTGRELEEADKAEAEYMQIVLSALKGEK